MTKTKPRGALTRRDGDRSIGAVGITRQQLFDALVTLRDASERGGPGHAGAWRAIDAWIVIHLVRPNDDRHREARQRTLIRVFKSVGNMKADSAPAAEGWLRRVYKSNLIDEHRRDARNPVTKGIRAVAPDRDEDRERHPVDRLEAPEETFALDDAELEPWIDRLLDRVDRYVEAHVPSPTKRAGDQLRARVAVMRLVHGLDTNEIEAQLTDPPSRSTLYKWVERGREEVLLPALEAWSGELDEGAPHEPMAAFVAALRRILEQSRRADAGKPRPGRRRDGSGTAGGAGGAEGGRGPLERRLGSLVSRLGPRASFPSRARRGASRRHARGEHA